MTNIKIFLSIIFILVVGVIASVVLGVGQSKDAGPGKYDALAQCLKEKGAIFYGAFWCPHCQAQKKAFGSSVKYLPYVECSTLDGKSQTPECKAKEVSSYPTWEFADGTRMKGEVPLDQLAAKTSCPLPTSETTVKLNPEATSDAVPQAE